MNLKTKYKQFINYFSVNYPDVSTELYYTSPFHLLVAIILSAQCTDKRVNIITPNLISKYPTANDMSIATIEEIFAYIKSCSYPNSKAKYLQTMSKMLVEKFDGEIPNDVENLQKLPGVGRKTANVMLSVYFNKPAMPVDTHVFRVSNRIGLVKTKTPKQTEEQLVKNIPGDLLNLSHHWLIIHGRYICMARSPKCNKCGISNICDYYEKTKKSNDV